MTVPPLPPPPPQPPPPAPAPAVPQPPDVGTLRVFILISLVVNALATMGWVGATVAGGAATCGVGCLLGIVPAVTIIALCLDAMALAKLNYPPNAYVAASVKNAAIMDIVAGVVGMSIVPVVMGILLLVYLDKPPVRAYFAAGQNG